MSEHQLTTTQPDSLAFVGQVMQAALERGVTAENAEAAKEMMALFERLADKKAERDFAAAFVALQSEMNSVQATKPVKNKDGSERYKFAPYEEIMATVKPLLQRHGFSLTFDMDFKEGRIIAKCTLMHTSGHKRTNEFAVRIGGGPPGSTETQADGAAMTYAKRFALCNALNIVIDKDVDGDARSLGAPITPAQAAELKKRVAATGADRTKFLAFAGAPAFEDIPSSKYKQLDQFLKVKEAAQQKRQSQPAAEPYEPGADDPEVEF